MLFFIKVGTALPVRDSESVVRQSVPVIEDVAAAKTRGDLYLSRHLWRVGPIIETCAAKRVPDF